MGYFRKGRAGICALIAVVLAAGVVTPSGAAAGTEVSANARKATQRTAPLPPLPGIDPGDRSGPDARPPRTSALVGDAAKAAQEASTVNGKLAQSPPRLLSTPAGAPADVSAAPQDCATVAKTRAKLTAAGVKSVLCTEVSKAPPRDPSSLPPNKPSSKPTTNLEPNPTPGQMPVWCSDIDYNGLYDRFKWCQQTLVTLRHVVVQTGEVLGWGLIYVWEWVELSNKAPTWQHKVELEPSRV